MIPRAIGDIEAMRGSEWSILHLPSKDLVEVKSIQASS